MSDAGLQTEPKNKGGNPKWKKGQSGNPRGRPRSDFDLQKIARTKTEKALSVLITIASDSKAPPSARVSAASAILDRGWGKPMQQVAASVNVNVAATYASQLMELADRASNAKVINDMSNIVEDDMLILMPVEEEPALDDEEAAE